MMRPSVRMDALIVFLAQTAWWTASLHAADPSPANLTLQIEDFGLLGLLGGSAPARPLPLAGMTIPTRLEALASDPAIDLMGQWSGLTEPAQLRPVVEELIDRGWLAETRSSHSARYEFTERGQLLERSVFHAGFIQIAVMRFAGDAFTAASAHICASQEQLATVAYQSGRQEFLVNSLSPGKSLSLSRP